MASRKRNEKLHVLDQNTALNVLDRVYENCHAEPISASFESLTSYIQYRKERHLIQRIFLVLVIIVLILMPICFISPKYDISTSTSKSGEEVYLIDVHSLMPIKSVIITENDFSLPAYERAFHKYEFQSIWGQDMTATVTLANGQYITMDVPPME